MQKLARMFWMSLVALFASAAFAQGSAPVQRSFSQAELDQVLAPIALYPDALLSQILMAATYPEDVYEAAAESRRNGLRGEDAVRAVERAPWDPSVLSLAAFPEVLSMMDERRDWTERLGDAYIAQPEQVMDTVQQLRRRADAAGSLRSSDEIIVQRSGDDYLIEPPSPDVVYVPYYDSRVVYGDWWWPNYQPVYWNPWPGYVYRSGYRGFGWGYGIRLHSGFFFGGIDWRHRHIRYSSHRPWYFHGHNYRGGNRWSHNRDHRYAARDPRWRGGDRDGRRGDRVGRDGRDGRWEGRDRGDRDGNRGREGRGGDWGNRERGDRGDRDRGGRDRRSQLAPAPQPVIAPSQQPAATTNAWATRQSPRYRSAEPRQYVQPRDPSNAYEGARRPMEARTLNAPRAASVPGAQAGQPRAARAEHPSNPIQRAGRAERAAVPAPREQRAATPSPRASERSTSTPSRSGNDNNGRGNDSGRGNGRGRDR